MNKKNKIHPIIKIILVLFVIYIIMFISSISGYYEGRIRNKVSLTNEKINEFEELIQNGEEIDLDAFLQKEEVDYSNKLSDFGEKMTFQVQEFVKESVNLIGNIFKTLF